ncbi:hypothetical protein JB92DRAFT_745322 [Gautieria morchelliformis]|nr:hypothetical protein JB92DRAFT_745322 [Gautieria morchelliformis]
MAETVVVLPGPNNQTTSSDTKMPPSKPARPEASPLRASTASPHVAIIQADNDTAKSSIQPSDARLPVKEVRPRSPQQMNTTQLLPSKEPPQSPRSLRVADDAHSRPVPQQQDMPPPSAPSSTPSAQELRTTAKVLSQRGDERSENKASRNGDMHPLSRPPSRPPSRGSARGTTPPPSRRRSLSPVPRGPPFENRVERPVEVDRSDRSSGRVFPPRQDRIQRPGMDADRIDRSPRDRAVSSGREIDRIRDPDRDRDRERDRERERERERDRHRRDWEKDKGRDHSVSRKDREAPVGREPPSHPRRDTLPDDLPTGPDLSRNRSFSGGTVEDHLGKRRRGPDEDTDRASKRSTRHKDATYRDDRGSRHKSERGERERPRESERSRRRDREVDGGSQGDGRGLPEGHERPSETSRSESSVGSKHAPAPPSAPRAMADTPARPSRGDFNHMRGDSRGRGWSGRDNGPPPSGHPSGHPSGGSHSRAESSGHSLNGLRGRDDEPPRSSHFPGTAPRNELPPFNGDRGGMFARDEARLHENPRKRTFSDRGREKDEGEGGAEANQPPKRLRINRTSRYALDDAMQKSLDSSRPDAKGDKGLGRTGRKD